MSQTRSHAGGYRQRYNEAMIETLYKTSKPEREKSECYVLVLARRTGDGKGLYAFMEEHGQWDDSAQRFLYQVMSIEIEDELTRQRALDHLRRCQAQACPARIRAFLCDGSSAQGSSGRSASRSGAGHGLIQILQANGWSATPPSGYASSSFPSCDPSPIFLCFSGIRVLRSSLSARLQA